MLLSFALVTRTKKSAARDSRAGTTNRIGLVLIPSFWRFRKGICCLYDSCCSNQIQDLIEGVNAVCSYHLLIILGTWCLVISLDLNSHDHEPVPLHQRSLPSSWLLVNRLSSSDRFLFPDWYLVHRIPLSGQCQVRMCKSVTCHSWCHPSPGIELVRCTENSRSSVPQTDVPKAEMPIGGVDALVVRIVRCQATSFRIIQPVKSL